MTFPNTNLTLILRLRHGGNERDWQQFLDDYWSPICRFAARRGKLLPDEAEYIASQTIGVLLQSRLLDRWQTSRVAKLRTLLCSVVTNILSNRARVQSVREAKFREFADQVVEQVVAQQRQAGPLDQELDDVFYAAWADELTHDAVRRLRAQLYRDGKGDYFRVLYSRLCEEMSIAEVAEALSISPAAVDNYFRAARKQLSRIFEDCLREHVERYSDPAEIEAEFQAEWDKLGQYLATNGGLEQVVRQQAGDMARQQPSSETRTLLRSLAGNL